MWDLETLRYLNDQAYLSSRNMVNKGIGEAPADTIERVFPLAVLAARLITGPPSLARLIDIVEGTDSIVEFLELIREFLPRHEAEIMAQVDDSNRITLFSRYFENQYFPLDNVIEMAGDDFTLGDFLRQIPVSLMGFTYEDYEQFNDFRDSFVLILSLIESPFEDAQRVAVLEHVKELTGKSLVELIPTDGWSLESIHRMLDGTEYEGCAAFADWVHSSTDCWQLDANYMDYEMEMWSRHVVDGLTLQWPRVVELQDKMSRMYEWLEEDLYHNFRKLLNVMLGVEDEPIAKEQIPLPLSDDGQVIRKEVIENG